MMNLQLVQSCCLALLALTPSLGSPVSSQCVDENFCIRSLDQYHSQLFNMPSHINERSVAPWSYVEKIDPERVPPVLYEAKCLTSHSCNGVDGPFSLETIPISVKVPVLRKNLRCSVFSLEYEAINIACLCVNPKQY